MELASLSLRIRKFIEVSERIIKYHKEANDPLFWFNVFYYGKASPVYVCWCLVESREYYSVTPCPTLPEHKDEWNKYDFEIQIHPSTIKLLSNGKAILQVLSPILREFLGDNGLKSPDCPK